MVNEQFENSSAHPSMDDILASIRQKIAKAENIPVDSSVAEEEFISSLAASARNASSESSPLTADAVATDAVSATHVQQTQAIDEFLKSFNKTQLHPQFEKTLNEPPVEEEDFAHALPQQADGLLLTKKVLSDGSIIDTSIPPQVAEPVFDKKSLRQEFDMPPSAEELGGANQVLELLVVRTLRPMLKDWIAENLPTLVEKIVREELRR